MKYKNPLLVVCDLEASIAFYREVLGLRVVRDFGANVTLTGGVCLQTKESWLGFLGVNEGAISFGGRDAELYFEEDAFDAFAARLAGMADVRYVHPVLEHRWGQRAVRFYDPDGHIIEVGESMKTVCLRFFASGMTPEETARRMDAAWVCKCMRAGKEGKMIPLGMPTLIESPAPAECAALCRLGGTTRLPRRP